MSGCVDRRNSVVALHLGQGDACPRECEVGTHPPVHAGQDLLDRPDNLDLELVTSALFDEEAAVHRAGDQAQDLGWEAVGFLEHVADRLRFFDEWI